MNKKRIVMKDVAAAAGVHQTTVSLALRDHPSLPVKTRDRIKQIANDLGYRPDPALSALSTYRQRITEEPPTQVIAFILNLANEAHLKENHVYNQLIKGARSRAEELGYKLEVFWFGKDYPRSKALDNVLKTRGIQGIILGAFSFINTDINLDWSAYSAVKINLLPVELEIDAVLSNQIFGVRLAIRKLLANGITRIGLAVADHDEIHNRNLFTSGFLMGQRNIPDPEDRIPPLIFTAKPLPELNEEIKEWAIKNEIHAIMSNWNHFDATAWEISQETERDCRFVPLDANDRTRPYGGIDQNHTEIGRRSVDTVVGQLNTFLRGVPDTHGMTLIDPIWHPFRTPWTEEAPIKEAHPVFVTPALL